MDVQQSLNQVGLPLFSIAQSRPSLDDVYLAATGRTLMDAELAAAGTRDLKKERKQNFYGFRYKRDVSNAIDESAMNDLAKSKRLLFSRPFWDLNSDRVSSVNTRSTIPTHPSQQKIMNGMMKKRWKIPGMLSSEAVSRCSALKILAKVTKMHLQLSLKKDSFAGNFL